VDAAEVMLGVVESVVFVFEAPPPETTKGSIPPKKSNVEDEYPARGSSLRKSSLMCILNMESSSTPTAMESCWGGVSGK
jgi:hypothetical protein